MTASVKLTRKGDIDTFEFDLPILDRISINYTGIPLEKRAGLARAFLSAAALSCYVGTLSDALETRKANVDSITAEAKVKTGENELGQRRVETMKLEVSVKMNEAHSTVFGECTEIMKKGCLVTSSIHDGIHMEYNLTSKYEG